jgi:hypothetical protein
MSSYKLRVQIDDGFDRRKFDVFSHLARIAIARR